MCCKCLPANHIAPDCLYITSSEQMKPPHAGDKVYGNGDGSSARGNRSEHRVRRSLADFLPPSAVCIRKHTNRCWQHQGLLSSHWPACMSSFCTVSNTHWRYGRSQTHDLMLNTSMTPRIVSREVGFLICEPHGEHSHANHLPHETCHTSTPCDSCKCQSMARGKRATWQRAVAGTVHEGITWHLPPLHTSRDNEDISARAKLWPII